MVLKIGFLLDSFSVPRWQREIIQFIVKHPALSVKLVALNVAPPKAKIKSRFVYKFFRRLDRKIFRVPHDAFTIEKTDTMFRDVEVLRIQTSRKKFVTIISEEDTAKIKDKNLDVLIRFGFGIIKGDILSAARFGVWSLHHGDHAVNRGGPPGFWEVVNREHVTGVTLQQLTEKLDGGVVLGKAFTRTDLTSFHRNQQAVYWSGVELFCFTLDRITKESISELIRENEQEAPYHRPLYRDPDNREALKIFTSFWARRLVETIRSLWVKKQWNLFHGKAYPDTPAILKQFEKLQPPAGYDWADPFVVFHQGRYFIFFEELLIKSRKAHISCFEFDWQGVVLSPKPTRVLEEKHHLSYPFLFEFENEWYMIPESAGAKEVVLYRCERFPDQWVRYRVLLKEVALFDPTLLQHEGIWYLFGTQRPWPGNSADQYLHIYFTSDLMGGWKPHAKNPVKRDVRGSRPAGKIFMQEGKLIRPSQLGAPHYGYGIRLHEIITLSPREFIEHPVKDILPDGLPEGRAVHTINFVKEFTVVDGQVGS
jgi:hypothetical protein